MQFPISRRNDNSDVHELMDVSIVSNQIEIFKQLVRHEFPADFLLAAEIQQLQSFTIPNGTKLLHSTGEFEKHSLKRLDDTRAILYHMGEHDFYSKEAEEMAAHLNKIHGMYNIPNDEFLYTLSGFIFELKEFINNYGWRKLTRNEELAVFHIYRRMGELMQIKNIPDSIEEYEEWKLAYENKHQSFSENNHLVSEGLMHGMKQMVPAFIGPFLAPFIFSLIDKKYSYLLGYKHPNMFTRRFFKSLMSIRRQFNKHFTIWDRLNFEKLVFTHYQTCLLYTSDAADD